MSKKEKDDKNKPDVPQPGQTADANDCNVYCGPAKDMEQEIDVWSAEVDEMIGKYVRAMLGNED